MNTRRYFAILAVLSAILVLAPLRTGDLTGYDDAQYAHQAKDILRSGNWLVLQSNGEPALENPPMMEWMQASLFAAFGFSDSLARLPSALCGLGVILLVYWLARRLTGDPFTALLAMFAMATSLYFLKYAARGMTDVPFTFFVLCAVCAWTLAEEDPRWYLAAGASTALAQMTRSMMGLALPAIFALHLGDQPAAACVALCDCGSGDRLCATGGVVCVPDPLIRLVVHSSACRVAGSAKLPADCLRLGGGIRAPSSMRGCFVSHIGHGYRQWWRCGRGSARAGPAFVAAVSVGRGGVCAVRGGA